MPSNRDLIAVAIWFGVGLLVFFAADDRQVRGLAPPPPAVLNIAKIEASAITEISIRCDGQEVKLTRDGDLWRVPDPFNARADQTLVEGLIEQTLSLKDAQRRGTGSGSYPSLEVGEADYTIELRGSGEHLPLKVVVGKVETFDRIFARFGDDPAVYSVTPNLRFLLEIGAGIDADRWVDRLVFEIPAEDEITSIRMQSADGSVVRVARVEEATTTPEGEPATELLWKVLEPEEFLADKSVMRGMASNVRRLVGTTLLDPQLLASSGLENNPRNVQIEAKSGATVEGQFGDLTEGDGKKGIFVRRKGDDRLFLLPVWMENNFYKSPDELRDKPFPPPGEAAAPPTPPAPGG